MTTVFSSAFCPMRETHLFDDGQYLVRLEGRSDKLDLLRMNAEFRIWHRTELVDQNPGEEVIVCRKIFRGVR